MTSVSSHVQFVIISSALMTLDVFVRYAVPKYHDAFVYLIDGMTVLTSFVLMQILAKYF